MSAHQPMIVGVVSSPRPEGNGATLVRAALRGAAGGGAATGEIFLSSSKIGFCQGCSRCLVEGKCQVGDDFEAIRGQLRAADGIILCSPVYGGTINATMKNLFDRLGMLEYMTSSVFGGKYVAAIATARREGTARKVARQLAYLPSGGVFQRAYVTGWLGVLAAPQGRELAPARLEAAGALGSRMVAGIRRGAAYPMQNIVHRAVASALIRPKFSQAIAAHRDGLMRGVYDDLAGRGLLPQRA